jgi:glycosyltransferase involved in cell wall biosynthesis
VRQVSERLVEHGHDVTVATTAVSQRTTDEIAGVKVAQFAISGNAVRGFQGDLGEYRAFVRDGGFDVIMAYAAQQWTFDALLDGIDQLPCPVVLAPCGFSALNDPAYARYFAELPEQLAGAAAIIVHSETYRDARFLAEHGLRATLVPNGADEREFTDLVDPAQARRRLGAGDGPLLLTVGGHTGQKGHAEALRALRRLHGHATLLMVGNVPLGRGCLPTCRVRAWSATAASLGRRRAKVLELSRADTLAAYSAVDVFVFASNIECSPIVLFEAAASATPFVAADVGNAAEIATWTQGGEIARTGHDAAGLARVDEADLADRVDALLADAGRREAMGRAARAAWQTAYTWETIAGRYAEVYAAAA